jgi:hypothetical protein
LQNYWPILNGNMVDYIAGANMTPVVNVSYISDRFGNSKAALFLNSGYCTVPPGVYFSSPCSIMAWVNPRQSLKYCRIFDFSNGQCQNNAIFDLSDGTAMRPSFGFLYGTDCIKSNFVATLLPVSLNEWSHVAGVYDGTNFLLYVNGILQNSIVASLSYSNPPNPVNTVRQNCYIGRSAWYPGDPDAIAYYDDLKFYNRPLTQAEILADMN